MSEGTQTGPRVRRGRYAAATVVVTAAIGAATLGLVGSALASSPATARLAAAPITGAGHGTPPGWAAVPFRQAQLSVPRSWLVETPQLLWCSLRTSGMIFVGMRPVFPKRAHCHVSASVAWIRPAGPGVRVGARGPLAKRVLATLTRSPLAVVLRPGPAGVVPPHWAWRQFGGVSFAAPGSWRLRRESRWATCGTGIEPRSLVLINATRPPEALPCPYPIPTAANDQAQSGLTVVTGKFAAESVGEKYGRCQLRRGVRVCLSSITGQGGLFGGVLIFSVSLPHQRVRTFFLLGLSGSGAHARAIFDSIGAASTH